MKFRVLLILDVVIIHYHMVLLSELKLRIANLSYELMVLRVQIPLFPRDTCLH